ncbi:hypothetical protein [Mycobacterium sp.]|uniref:hypothetical protein n=1 Tax=Mycobacterium sp. TaxID=1785 RepID=UPI002D6F49F4|nr:hypothetical protein [Mycobacterium sp.]HZA11652.1 hypothetical protein [Mycobacterium sp.]
MNDLDSGVPVRGSRMRIPRSRGAASGFLLILLGVWGGLIPFVGPYFDFAYTPDQEWTWTAARGWLEVLPGAATVVGGLLLLGSGHRATAMLGGWLTVIAGAWFVIGTLVAGPLGIGSPGDPVAATDIKRAWLELAYFYGLGALIVFLGATALGRLSVRTVRDLKYAQQPVAAAEPAPAQAPLADETPTTVQPSGPAAATSRHAAPEAATAAEEQRPRRRLGDLFRRRDATASDTTASDTTAANR